MPLDGLHDDRNRAESFGSAAEEYDRYRPPYPGALVDDLLAGSPSNVLDVGCGTGKVAVPILERGIPVLGVEPDLRMAQVARRHHVPVEVASFESWDPAGRTFDLLTAGHSWHWVDPAIGLAKAASVVNPDGIVALFWNYHVLDDDLLSAFDVAYNSHAPELSVVGRDPSDAADTDPFSGSSQFRSLGSRTYRWSRVLDAEEWTRMLETFSDHARLGDARLSLLRRSLYDAIEQSGGLVHSQCGTYVWTAQKLGGEHHVDQGRCLLLRGRDRPCRLDRPGDVRRPGGGRMPGRLRARPCADRTRWSHRQTHGEPRTRSWKRGAPRGGPYMQRQRSGCAAELDVSPRCRWSVPSRSGSGAEVAARCERVLPEPLGLGTDGGMGAGERGRDAC